MCFVFINDFSYAYVLLTRLFKTDVEIVRYSFVDACTKFCEKWQIDLPVTQSPFDTQIAGRNFFNSQIFGRISASVALCFSCVQ